MTVESSFGDFLNLQSEWERLFAESPNASPPLHFDWLRAWWTHYGGAYGIGPKALRIVTLRRGDSLIGAIPLYLGRSSGFPRIRRLCFLSTGEAEFEEVCADYLDLLCLPGEESACAAALSQVLYSARTDWDEIDLCDMKDSSPLHASARDSGELCVVEPRGTCPIADLSGGFETYLQRLSPNTRQQARRQLREAEEKSAVLEIADSDSVETFYEDLVQLHQSRWTAQGMPGCFSAPRFRQFHHEMATKWTPTGMAALARLSIDGKPIAALYGFLCRERFLFYQSGVLLSEESPLRSSGNVAHLLLMRHLSERGITAYDFLRGSSSYKERLATDEQPLIRIRLIRRTPRALAGRTVERLRATARRCRKLTRRNSASGAPV